MRVVDLHRSLLILGSVVQWLGRCPVEAQIGVRSSVDPLSFQVPWQARARSV